MSEEEIVKLKEHVAEFNPDALMADGFEDAFIGVVNQFNKYLACYEYDQCITILMTRDGMDREEAEEFFEFNVAGAWVGENTPCFLNRLPSESVS